MKKEVTVCFRTSAELRSALEKAARDDHRTISAVIEIVLTDYLENNHEFPHQRERQLFVRKQVDVDTYLM
jgi:hypothetical protein